MCEVHVASAIQVLAVGGATVVENRDSRGWRVVGRCAYVFVVVSARALSGSARVQYHENRLEHVRESIMEAAGEIVVRRKLSVALLSPSWRKLRSPLASFRSCY